MKKVFISGGTGGIGTNLSTKFLEHGYHVLSTHNNKSDNFLETWKQNNNVKDHQITFLNCDITKATETLALISKLLYEHEIDVLINNAGINSDSTFIKMSADQWLNVLNVNLFSIFFVTQPIARQMVAKRAGCIINISSINGQRGQFGQTNYSASKAGILGFTKSLALELASKGVRVNAICPGYTDTNMLETIPTEILQKIKQTIPMQNFVGPREIADAALFIAEGVPSMTGEAISINGGQLMK